MTSPLDPDIAVMEISESEKAGLQVYRNYSRAFERERAQRFIKSLGSDSDALLELPAVLELVATEEPRSLPVIACAFADDQLKEMFRREIPAGVPGGRSELLTGFGPLARLSQRVQMAFAFGWLSADLLVEIDHLRKLRNEISHKWDQALLETKLSQLIEHRQQKIEHFLGDGIRLPKNLHEVLSPHQRLRLRLIWLLGRVTYESRVWVPALRAGLVPHKVLYGANPPPMLAKVSTACLEATRSHVIPNFS